MLIFTKWAEAWIFTAFLRLHPLVTLREEKGRVRLQDATHQTCRGPCCAQRLIMKPSAIRGGVQAGLQEQISNGDFFAHTASG